MSEKNFLVEQRMKYMKEGEGLTIQTKEGLCKIMMRDGEIILDCPREEDAGE